MILILCASAGMASGQKEGGATGATEQEIVLQDTWKRQQLFKKTDLKTVSANELLKQFNEISDHSIALLKANKPRLSPVFYEKQLIDFVYNKKNNAMGIPFMLQGLGNCLEEAIGCQGPGICHGQGSCTRLQQDRKRCSSVFRIRTGLKIRAVEEIVSKQISKRPDRLWLHAALQRAFARESRSAEANGWVATGKN